MIRKDSCKFLTDGHARENTVLVSVDCLTYLKILVLRRLS